MNEKDSLTDAVRDFIFEYSIFLITAARGTLDEPRTYGALRLIDGITRLTELYSKSQTNPDNFMLEIRAEIQSNLDYAMKSEELLTEFMDKLILKFTDEMKTRYEISS